MAGKGKVVPTLVYGVIAVGGALGLWSLVTQANFGLSLANVPTYAVSLVVFLFGMAKLAKIDVVQKVSVV